MFERARLTLTLWYLIIIMLISGVFSVVIYNGATHEIRRIIHVEELRRQNTPSDFFLQPTQQIFVTSITDLEESENRLKLILIAINAGILIVAGGAGYFLAGRTLRPIRIMVDEQNRFISDASHELRTPITAARTETEVALRDKNLTIDAARQILTSNLEEIIGIQTLSNSLLRLTQVHNFNGKLPFTKVDLAEIVHEAVKKITPLAKAKAIKLETKQKTIFVLGERQSLVELLVILLDNAIKYSPEKSRILLEIARSDGKALISVVDYGIGIAKKDIPHIFDRFYRAEKSRSKQEADGFGLGLAIAKKIVEEHNGTLVVKSEMEKGSTFTVTLPVNS
jgi:signal transduction histidine kinase